MDIKTLGSKLYFVVYPEDMRLTYPSSTGAYGMTNNSLLRKQSYSDFGKGPLSGVTGDVL